MRANYLPESLLGSGRDVTYEEKMLIKLVPGYLVMTGIGEASSWPQTFAGHNRKLGPLALFHWIHCLGDSGLKQFTAVIYECSS